MPRSSACRPAPRTPPRASAVSHPTIRAARRSATEWAYPGSVPVPNHPPRHAYAPPGRSRCLPRHTATGGVHRMLRVVWPKGADHPLPENRAGFIRLLHAATAQKHCRMLILPASKRKTAFTRLAHGRPATPAAKGRPASDSAGSAGAEAISFIVSRCFSLRIA